MTRPADEEFADITQRLEALSSLPKDDEWRKEYLLVMARLLENYHKAGVDSLGVGYLSGFISRWTNRADALFQNGDPDILDCLKFIMEFRGAGQAVFNSEERQKHISEMGRVTTKRRKAAEVLMKVVGTRDELLRNSLRAEFPKLSEGEVSSCMFRLAAPGKKPSHLRPFIKDFLQEHSPRKHWDVADLQELSNWLSDRGVSLSPDSVGDLLFPKKKRDKKRA